MLMSASSFIMNSARNLLSSARMTCLLLSCPNTQNILENFSNQQDLCFPLRVTFSTTENRRKSHNEEHSEVFPGILTGAVTVFVYKDG